MTEDFFRMATSLRAGIKRAGIPSISDDENPTVQKMAFQARYFELTSKIGNHLNPVLDNSVGVVIGGEKMPALFDINSDTTMLVMPVVRHPYSNMFAEGAVEDKSPEPEKFND